MVCLNGTWDMLLTDKVGTEEHESIRWAWDVAKGPSLARWYTAAGRTMSGDFRRREEGGGR